jgi:hypothetical protein
MLATLALSTGCITPATAQAPAPEAKPDRTPQPFMDGAYCHAWPSFFDTQGRIMERNPCVRMCRQKAIEYVIINNVAVPCWVIIMSLHREAQMEQHQHTDRVRGAALPLGREDQT